MPQYEAKIDDVSYFVPLCKSGSQTLWRNDGTSLKIDCKGVTFSTGESFQIPGDLSNSTDSKCHDVTTNGMSVCYSKRFPSWNATQDTVAIPAGREVNPYSNVTAIAEALETVGNHDGLAGVGCGSYRAFNDVAEYYFGKVQAPLAGITSSDQNLTDFYHDISSSSQNVTSHGSTWMPQADEMLQNLVCHIDTSDGKSSRLVRALDKLSTLHTGINTLVSISNLEASQKSLRNLIKDLFDNHVAYIGRESSIIQGWTQAYRLCLTNWDEGSLSKPQIQKPIRDDFDDWYATYSIIISPGTTMDELRGLEHALGVEGSETAPADGNPALWKGYTANLNLVQAKLPDSTAFVKMTERSVWDGKSADSDDPFKLTDSNPNESSRQSSTTAKIDTARSRDSKTYTFDNEVSGRDEIIEKRQQPEPWDPRTFPLPADDAQKVTGLTGKSHLKVISQQKGQATSDTDSYTFASPVGEGSWVFVLDGGFDLNHKVNSSIIRCPLIDSFANKFTQFLDDQTRNPAIKRKILTYVVPNEKILAAVPPDWAAQGWRASPEVIDDNQPDRPLGHGTGVACVAAGSSNKIGVAPETNLYLIKWNNFYVKEKDGQVVETSLSPSLYLAWIDAYTRIYNAWLPVDQNGEGINPHKSVINLSNGSPATNQLFAITYVLAPSLDSYSWSKAHNH